MATTQITKITNMKKTIEYCDSDKPKNSGAGYEHIGDRRVLFRQAHMVNSKDTLHQMTMTQRVHNKDTGYVKGHHLIQSFSVDELDPADEKSQIKANVMGYALAKELYPDAQWVVYTHADGDGGQLHNHIVVNAVQPDGRSLRGDCRRWGYIAKKNDEIVAKYGLTPLPEENYTEAKDNRYNGSKRPRNGEYWMNKRDEVKYSWKDDLKTRVNDAYSDESVHSYDEFIEALEERGVNVNEGKRGLEYEFLPRKGATTKKLTARKIDDDPKRFTEQGLIDEYESRHQKAMDAIRARDAEVKAWAEEQERQRMQRLAKLEAERREEQARIAKEQEAERQKNLDPSDPMHPNYFAYKALQETKEKELQRQQRQRPVIKDDNDLEL